MNVIDIFKKNLKNIPDGAEEYNFDLNCFTKKIGLVEYYYADYSNKWRVHSRMYDKNFAVVLEPTTTQHIIDCCTLINDNEAIKQYIISENLCFKHINNKHQ